MTNYRLKPGVSALQHKNTTIIRTKEVVTREYLECVLGEPLEQSSWFASVRRRFIETDAPATKGPTGSPVAIPTFTAPAAPPPPPPVTEPEPAPDPEPATGGEPTPDDMTD